MNRSCQSTTPGYFVTATDLPGPEPGEIPLLPTVVSGNFPRLRAVSRLVKPFDEARQADWDKERKKELAKQQKNPNKPVRPIWSADSHSLTALFDAHPNFKAKVKIVDKAKSHCTARGF